MDHFPGGVNYSDWTVKLYNKWFYKDVPKSSGLGKVWARPFNTLLPSQAALGGALHKKPAYAAYTFGDGLYADHFVKRSLQKSYSAATLDARLAPHGPTKICMRSEARGRTETQFA
ncbi:hypothetical protein FQR65_LT07763 [Abscondita terminalis]|nr:hypothetical protein FQR65_LT07763 [Abscondita terminalis]